MSNFRLIFRSRRSSSPSSSSSSEVDWSWVEEVANRHAPEESQWLNDSKRETPSLEVRTRTEESVALHGSPGKLDDPASVAMSVAEAGISTATLDPTSTSSNANPALLVKQVPVKARYAICRSRKF